MSTTSREEILLSVKQVVAEETGKQISAIDEGLTFHSLGLDSISVIVILDALENKYGVSLTPLHFWDHPTIGAFTDFLTNELNKKV